MSPPTPTTERALEALIHAVTSLAQTLRASDSQHGRSQGAIVARLDEIQGALVAVLSALGKPAARNGHGVHVEGDTITASFPRAATVGLIRRAAPFLLAALTGVGGYLWRHLVGQ